MAAHDPVPAAPPAASQATARATAPLRLSVAQTTVPEDPTDPGALRESGAQIRQFMRDAAASGARLAQFPEGAITYPGKHIMSSAGPGTLAEADWSRIDWDVMREEAQQIAALSGHLRIWTVFGSLHPLTPPSRPHNSLYVITPDGRPAVPARVLCREMRCSLQWSLGYHRTVTTCDAGT